MAKLYFRYGAMNCGKTARLLQAVHNYEARGMKEQLKQLMGENYHEGM